MHFILLFIWKEQYFSLEYNLSLKKVKAGPWRPNLKQNCLLVPLASTSATFSL